MPEYELITAGEAFEDLVFLNLPRLPRLGEELKTGRFLRTIGGGAVITAVGAARLGIKCLVVSALGADAVRRLRREGVWIQNLRRKGEPHALTAALSTGTDRTFVTYNGVNAVLEDRLLEPIQHARGRHLHLALYPADCSRWMPILANLKEQGITTSWDFGWNEGLIRDVAFEPLLGILDFLFVNEQEALLYSGGDNLDAAEAFFRENTLNTLIKLGAHGCRWVSTRGSISSPALTLDPVDPTGAGDAFNAGFLSALIRGRSRDQCLAEGNRVGGLSTLRAGGLDGLPVFEKELP